MEPLTSLQLHRLSLRGSMAMLDSSSNTMSPTVLLGEMSLATLKWASFILPRVLMLYLLYLHGVGEHGL